MEPVEKKTKTKTTNKGEDLLLVQEEDLLLVQEVDLLRVQVEDRLLVQEEDLLVQEEDLLIIEGGYALLGEVRLLGIIEYVVSHVLSSYVNSQT